MNKKIRNYLLLVIVIFVSICIMLIIGNIYKYVNSRKENRSYIVNKVKSYDFENIVNGIDDVKNNGLLYISYIGNEKIYNFEKESYKILKNNNLISKFVYIDCTKDVNNGKVDNLSLLKYGLYVCLVGGEILGFSKEEINKMDKQMPIHKISDVKINNNDIMNLLGIDGSPKLRVIYDDIVDEILKGKVKNNKRNIKKYIIKKWM